MPYPTKIETIVNKIFQDKVRHSDIYMIIYLNYCKIQYLSNGEEYPKPIFDPDTKVFCFSKTRSSFPMWAHYANNYKGVCLEYDARNVRLSLDCDVPDYAFNNVQYVDNFKTDNLTLYDKDLQKSKQWEYEQEVRIVCKMKGNILKFPYLKKVFLGMNMPPKERIEIATLCFENQVDVYDVETCIDGQYNLNFCKRGDLFGLQKKLGFKEE